MKNTATHKKIDLEDLDLFGEMVNRPPLFLRGVGHLSCISVGCKPQNLLNSTFKVEIVAAKAED